MQATSSAPRFSGTQHILGHLGSFALRLLRRTLRVKTIGLHDEHANHWSCGEPAIVVCWHEQQLLMPWVYLSNNESAFRKKIYVIVSGSADGRLAASLLEKLSISTVAGSSSKGGARALVEMRRRLKLGDHVGLTPDGPRGPARIAKKGAVKLASLTGCPILPAAFASQNNWTVKSWDSLTIPKPFSKSVLLVGPPISVEANLGEESLSKETLRLTQSLNAANDEATEHLLNAN